MRVFLFEDLGVHGFEPLTLTRPVFDLLCGQSSLAEKHARFFHAPVRGVLVRPCLEGLLRQQSPCLVVNDLPHDTGLTTLVNGRWLPPPGQTEDCSGPGLRMVGEEVAYAVVGRDHLEGCTPDNLDEFLERWQETLPRHEAGGLLFRHLWEMVRQNGEQVLRDWEGSGATPAAAAASPALVGPPEGLVLDPTARLDPLVVADTTGGPVVIGPGAVITAFTRLEGPCCVGPQTQVHGAKVRAGTTLGPQCRVGGEVEASIVQGYSNKYHDGFLGHAYVGEWVNLGAGTQSSDLRHDYGPVTVTVGGRSVDTGQAKVGCFVGDHTKTAIGTLLNTGTNAGIFCSLLPGGLLPRYLPSFASWWNETLTDRADLDELLAAAATAMGRRGRVLTEVHAELYRTVFEQTAAERRRVVREAEKRRLRRGA